MAQLTGSVHRIQIRTDRGVVSIKNDAGLSTKFFIWSDYRQDYSPQERLIHGMWTAMLRDAFMNNLTVEVSYEGSSVSSSIIAVMIQS